MRYLCRHWTENVTACVLGCRLVGVASRVIVYSIAASLYLIPILDRSRLQINWSRYMPNLEPDPRPSNRIRATYTDTGPKLSLCVATFGPVTTNVCVSMETSPVLVKLRHQSVDGYVYTYIGTPKTECKVELSLLA
jgi:hypothetical protein